MQKATERALQVSIEVMIDVSERILALNEIPPANTSAENLKKLEQIGVIRTFDDYVSMIKFRNFIVHHYEKIDIEIVYSILKNKLHLFTQFAEEIRTT